VDTILQVQSRASADNRPSHDTKSDGRIPHDAQCRSTEVNIAISITSLFYTTITTDDIAFVLAGSPSAAGSSSPAPDRALRCPGVMNDVVTIGIDYRPLLWLSSITA